MPPQPPAVLDDSYLPVPIIVRIMRAETRARISFEAKFAMEYVLCCAARNPSERADYWRCARVRKTRTKQLYHKGRLCIKRLALEDLTKAVCCFYAYDLLQYDIVRSSFCAADGSGSSARDGGFGNAASSSSTTTITAELLPLKTVVRLMRKMTAAPIAHAAKQALRHCLTALTLALTRSAAAIQAEHGSKTMLESDLKQAITELAVSRLCRPPPPARATARNPACGARHPVGPGQGAAVAS
eukprot:scaffold8.g1690.t1